MLLYACCVCVCSVYPLEEARHSVVDYRPTLVKSCHATFSFPVHNELRYSVDPGEASRIKPSAIFIDIYVHICNVEMLSVAQDKHGKCWNIKRLFRFKSFIIIFKFTFTHVPASDKAQTSVFCWLLTWRAERKRERKPPPKKSGELICLTI